jgi:hypothetical protein
MPKPSVQQVKQLHVWVRGHGEDCAILLSHCSPIIHRGGREMTGNLSVMNAEEGVSKLCKLMPLDLPVQIIP